MKTTPLRSPAMEAVLTMWAGVPCRRMTGTKLCSPWTTPHTLTSKTQRQSSSVWSRSRLNVDTPALLHNTSTRPNRSSVVAASPSTAAAPETSTVTAAASPPVAWMPDATTSASAPSRSATTTAEPAAANSSARARPMPLAAPVTTATRPGPITSFDDSAMSLPSAAVEHDQLTGQVRRRIARKVERRSHDLVGGLDPTEADERCHLRLHLLRGHRRVEAVGVEGPAHDRVHPDAPRPELAGRRLRERVQPRLRGRIHNRERRGVQRRLGADVDH